MSPMMQHYTATKEQYHDCILFYRLGDFYEMFFEDAKTVSKELELTLTGKDCGLEERAPMCGIPYHAAESYIERLIEKGYKVAVCEQMEDPKLAKGMVKREVIRVVTPGTNLMSESLDETRNNYLMSIVNTESGFGLAIADVSTGLCMTTEIEKANRLLDEISKYRPAEIICNQALFLCELDFDSLRSRMSICINALEDSYFEETACRKILTDHFKTADVTALGLDENGLSVAACGALFRYLKETQMSDLGQMKTLTPYVTDKYLLIDSSSRRNLELCETLREKQKRGTLLWVLDKTMTAMGARLLRNYIEQPLIDTDQINKRLDAVQSFCEQPMIRDEIREYLRPVYDMERLLARITYQSAGPRDLAAFKTSLSMLPYVKQCLNSFSGGVLAECNEELDALEDLFSLIDSALVEDPPYLARDGGMIRDGYHEMVDTYRAAKTEGKRWLADVEAEEREKTGIRNLKVKYNKVFGYYLEVTNSFKNLVPDYYIRKQTLTNAERYITPRLKELEDKILGAEEKLVTLENELFCAIRDTISGEVERIQQTARAIAKLDVYASLSLVADRNNYVRPKLNNRGKIQITEGRHPVVERMIPNELFVANDTLLDNNENRLSIITGPNMAGKSTYMRQTALIVLMAQIGSFVPARKANIGIVDKIFTRVGASDDLASGQSTFMVEMTEVANILKNATPNSLLILDEIGRGTSTFDGLAIAWAVIEHVANTKLLGAKTLFATHYHELTELEGKLPGVHNYCIAVREKGGSIIFLRKIIAGGADKSYGIQVARLAGVPESVLNRAAQLVAQLSDADITATVKTMTEKKTRTKPVHYDDVDMQQMSLFDTVQDDDIIRELGELDISNMTPLDALNTLYRFQGKIKNRWQA